MVTYLKKIPKVLTSCDCLSIGPLCMLRVYYIHRRYQYRYKTYSFYLITEQQYLSLCLNWLCFHNHLPFHPWVPVMITMILRFRNEITNYHNIVKLLNKHSSIICHQSIFQLIADEMIFYVLCSMINVVKQILTQQ